MLTLVYARAMTGQSSKSCQTPRTVRYISRIEVNIRSLPRFALRQGIKNVAIPPGRSKLVYCLSMSSARHVQILKLHVNLTILYMILNYGVYSSSGARIWWCRPNSKAPCPVARCAAPQPITWLYRGGSKWQYHINRSESTRLNSSH